jgi:aminoglycoside 6'-N-acetyltransferase
MAIADRTTDELIGDIGVFIRPDATSAEIGFTLRTESQGKGLASEAVPLALALLFDRTSIDVVEAIIDSRNQPALDLAARIGMERVRVVHTEFRGEPCTEIMNVLRRTQARG